MSETGGGSSGTTPSRTDGTSHDAGKGGGWIGLLKAFGICVLLALVGAGALIKMAYEVVRDHGFKALFQRNTMHRQMKKERKRLEALHRGEKDHAA